MQYRTYEDCISEVYNGFVSREAIEWSNTWIDNADRQVSPRYLLIGDSTARMVRSTLASLAGCPVDMIGTSSNIDDELFVSIIDAFFRRTIYKYDAIFVQLGHHGRIGRDGGQYGEEDFVIFTHSFQQLLTFLRQYSNNIIVESIFDAVIPSSKSQRMLQRLRICKEQKDDSINAITQHKNTIIKGLATQMGGVFLDINSYMNHTHFLHIDHIHFEKRAKRKIAQRMLQAINDIVK